MDLYSIATGPLLWVVLSIFTLCVLARMIFFTLAIIRSPKLKAAGFFSIVLNFFRLFVPFHVGVLKRPIYAPLRHIFHICLFVVPIWLAGHIALWSESRFEWSWTPIPAEWADIMTLIVIALAAFFFMRRIVMKEVRQNSSLMDFVVILVTALPFISGYFLVHSTLESIPFFSANMTYIHIFTSCAMILMAGFLFCRTRLIETRCVACTSCEQSCPTGTIEYRDQGRQRIFTYSHYQCICCAACVKTCPENAAELRHELSLKRFFQIRGKHVIRTAEMQACEKCGALFAPEPQMQKVGKIFTHHDYLRFCQNCRKTNMGVLYQKLSPWHRPADGAKKPEASLKNQAN
ncbi:MAG: hypothetical protein EHM45_09385 [Desulfobacteraceae bacterium]|nr:MAG: hypothetical protein EHM45_09385 [Desulfobacteraceae bacterium]